MIITNNDIWRLMGLIMMIIGYFFDREMSIQWGDKSFTGGMFGIVGVVLVLAPIFLRKYQGK